MSNKTYYAKGNLKHNGVFHVKGDAVNLDKETGARLVRAKVVQTAPFPEEDIDPVVTTEETIDVTDGEKSAAPEAGGEKQKETGEPSIDSGNASAPVAQGGILGRMFNKPAIATEKVSDSADLPEGSAPTDETSKTVTDSGANTQGPKDEPLKDPSVGM